MPYITRSVCSLSSSLRYISDELGSILEQYFSVSPHKRTIAYLEDDGEYGPYLKMEKRRAIHGIS